MSAKMRKAHNAVALFAINIGRAAIRREPLLAFYQFDTRLVRAAMDTMEAELIDACCLLVRGNHSHAILHEEVSNG